MRVMLDEELCDVKADSVGEAITAASHLAEQTGRMVVEIVVDGQTWTAAELDAPERLACGADEVRMTSAQPLELVGQTFADASVALQDAAVRQQKAAELFQSDQIPAAMTELKEAITIWMSVQQALVMGSDLAEIDLDQPGVDGNRTVLAMIEDLNGQLCRMRDALEGQDTVALADTLLYDLPPVIQQWQHLLENLGAQVSGRAQGQ